jgi:methylated-DNA-[protein]-cysteine S-methyltransferase
MEDGVSRRRGKMARPQGPAWRWTTFDSPIGWFALAIDEGGVVHELTLAHRSASAALAAIRPELAGSARPSKVLRSLTRRIQAYLGGRPDDFLDVEVDTSYLTPLGRRVFAYCRRIPFGETRTYGELAAAVGRRDAARAMGQFMASNRTPLVVPCHRVVAAGGGLGGFSAPGGIRLKRTLLHIESQSLIAETGPRRSRR